MDRYISTVDDVLRLLDGLFAPEADRWRGDAGSRWWDSFYADRSKPVPFVVAKPDENLVSYLDRSMVTPGRALDLGCGPAATPCTSPRRDSGGRRGPFPGGHRLGQGPRPRCRHRGRFPTCQQRAATADLDHTIPYEARSGSTSEHNLHAGCRISTGSRPTLPAGISSSIPMAGSPPLLQPDTNTPAGPTTIAPIQTRN
jgi:hypothetical protein